MSENIIKQFEAMVRDKFYETYDIDVVDKKYIIKGGVVRDANPGKKRKRKKKKGYCATEYMKIDEAE